MTIAAGLLLGQAIVLVVLGYLSAWFLSRLRRASTARCDATRDRDNATAAAPLPKAVLLMGLKGCDPRMAEGLRTLPGAAA